ncbi:MAG TPA: hypothetical protein PLY91_04150 [Methanoregulaceae archaeon]|nr:hypothetical protein [Methanoregulaceae archaeon]
MTDPIHAWRSIPSSTVLEITGAAPSGNPRMRIGCFELVDASNDGTSGNSIPICGSLAIPPPESEPDASLIMPGVIQSSLRSRV